MNFNTLNSQNALGCFRKLSTDKKCKCQRLYYYSGITDSHLFLLVVYVVKNCCWLSLSAR